MKGKGTGLTDRGNVPMSARAERGFGDSPVFPLHDNPPADSGPHLIQNPEGLDPLLKEGGATDGVTQVLRTKV